MQPIQWKMLPTGLVTPELMKSLTWAQADRSSNAAALMMYVGLAVYAAPTDEFLSGLKTGEAKPTYEQLKIFSGLSRDLINRGIQKLIELEMISKRKNGVGTIYVLNSYNSSLYRWGKIPHKYFSRKNEIRPVFHNMSVRNKVTLHALKIYLMLIKFRDDRKNYASISYDKLIVQTGVRREDVKRALMVLSENRLIIIDTVRSDYSDHRHNIYRICGVHNTRHLANLPDDDFDDLHDSF